MKKIILNIALCICSISAYGQTALPDTIYIYETVIVYDTIVIRDTVRVKKAMNMPVVSPVSPNDIIFTSPTKNNISLSPTATFSEKSIIQTDDIKKSNHHKKDKEMKLNILNYASAAILAAHTFSGISAQEANRATEEEPLPTMPVQFSIAYPMTSMGNQTKDYRFHFSFNLFSGYVGAVKGIEYGLIMNHVERDMTGVQFAGIGNRAREMNGIQFSSIYNVSSTVAGIQFGGITNISKDVSNGIQFSSIANISESVKGIQFGGIANLSESVMGMQFGGITNTSRNVTGIQFGGTVNYSESITGIQFGGVGNVSEEVTGIQFGGIFNRTGTLRGLQFAGIVNITDTIEKGASIALINIVKKGFYHAWELSFADYQNVGVSFKMGTQKFYTIFSAGANFMEDKLWVAGFGFGNRTALGLRVDFQPEIVGYQYFPNDFKNVRSANSNHLKLGFVFRLNERLGLVVAPSIYHFYAEDDGNGNYYKLSPVSPFFRHERGTNRHSFGAGISIGLLFNK